MKIFDTGHGKIHYYFKEAANNYPTVLFFQGATAANCYLGFKNIITALPQNYGILAIDQLGYGKSDVTKSDRTLNHIMDETKAIVDCENLKKVILFAHSLGGLYALGYVKKYVEQVVAVIGVEPVTGTADQDADAFAEAVKQEANEISQMRAHGGIPETDLREHINPYLDKEEYDAQLKIFRETLDNSNQVNEAEHAKESVLAIKNQLIPDKILVLLFSRPARSSEYENSEFKNINEQTRICYCGNSHFLHWTESKRVISETNHFLKQIEN